ncbi:ABC transporter permease [Jiangella mangrovi]|uniref:ABC-2 type transport system permease protein n=1 Tax=Jiangella mangrovi TaxID=1524084 RepID=A0A7W9LJ42_9ACTN|nr:ABC transporter permease [Jiangella mangrovi]MBB5785695.1 ABC-2 type transport system permease protein [Jiangella mangrovi]
MNATYTLLEIRRLLRDRAALVLTAGLPTALFLLYNAMWGDDTGATTSLMVMMGVFAGLASTVSAGGRVAQERHAGWTRQLRLSPLRPLSYALSKSVVALVLGMLAATLVFVVGLAVQGGGADLPAMAESLLLLWVASIPFALIGVLLGQVGSAGSAQPRGMVVLLGSAFLGGVFVPIDQLPSGMEAVAQWYPSYWLNALAQAPFGESVDVLRGVLTLVVWTVVLAGVVRWRYGRAER